MDFMEWVNALSPSAAQFWGSVVGVGGGLTAILTGAFVNAALNRRRDNRLRDQEARAVAAALRGELASIRISIADLLPVWKEGEREFREIISRLPDESSDSEHVNAAEYARLPPSHVPIFEANAPKLGLLGSNLAGACSVLYTNYRVRAVEFEEPLNIKATDLPVHYSMQIKWGDTFCMDCEEFERLLTKFEKTGKSPTPDEVSR